MARICPARLVVLAIISGWAVAVHSATPTPSVFDYLKGSGLTRTLSFLDALGINPKNTPSAVPGTLLAPTNEAWDAFLKSMDLTEADLKARQGLLDIIIAYHFIPGVAVKGPEEIKENPTIAETGDINYILRFYKENGKVLVQDVQGNKVELTKEATQLGKTAIVPVKKVLLSGGYFTSTAAALKHYPQWSESFAFSEAVSLLDPTIKDYTMFVPVNSAWSPASKKTVDALPKQQQHDLMLYHFVQPALHIPNTLKDGKYETLFKGHYVGVKTTFTDGKNPITGKAAKIPVVKVYPEVGSAGKVVVFNIYVRRSVLNGIDQQLTPKLPAATGGRRLLSRLFSGPGNNRQLLALQNCGVSCSTNGMSQGVANTVWIGNARDAIDAAASGEAPAAYATYYGNLEAIANPPVERFSILPELRVMVELWV